MLRILKTLSFSQVAEALTDLIYHRPADKNSSFSGAQFCMKQDPGFLDQLVVSDDAIFGLNLEVNTHNVEGG